MTDTPLAAGSATGSALQALRASTAQHHVRIEALLAFDRVTRLDAYRRILLGFDAFHRAWEPAVRAALPPDMRPWLERRSRRRWLLEDLRSLGAPPAGSAPGPDPLHGFAASIDTVAAALGSLYVIEGSALGGQVVCKQLAATMGLGPAHGAAYFHGHGAATGALWREFKSILEQRLGGEPEAIARACRAACATFDALSATMSRCMGARDHVPGPDR